VELIRIWNYDATRAIWEAGLWVIKKKRSDWYVAACGKSDHFPNILEDPYVKGREKWRNQGR
jgi:hypothetical protein